MAVKTTPLVGGLTPAADLFTTFATRYRRGIFCCSGLNANANYDTLHDDLRCGLGQARTITTPPPHRTPLPSMTKETPFLQPRTCPLPPCPPPPATIPTTLPHLLATHTCYHNTHHYHTYTLPAPTTSTRTRCTRLAYPWHTHTCLAPRHTTPTAHHHTCLPRAHCTAPHTAHTTRYPPAARQPGTVWALDKRLSTAELCQHLTSTFWDIYG